MKNKQIMKTNMAAGIIGTIVISLVLFGIIVGGIGFFSFTDSFKTTYSETTYNIADTASTLINADNIDAYLSGSEMDEYLRTKRFLNGFCDRINVSLIYVIKPDTRDYGSFVSVFNAVDNTVDNSNYTPWEIGHRRETSNEEYRQKYKNIYENGSPYEIIYRMKSSESYHPHITMLLPLRKSSGEVTAIICVQRPFHEIVQTLQTYLVTVILTVIVLSVILAYLVSSAVAKQFVIPVMRVSEEATRFARESTVGKPLGKISQYNEISNLALSIDKMEVDTVTYIKNLTAATSERERINAELDLAGSIQENAIPNEFPAFPDRSDFDLYATMTPAKGVGGDFYNFYLIDDDHLVVVIGDVSGKGIPGALFMMVSNIVLTERINMGGTPAEIMNHVNNSICEHNEMDMFVTLWLGIIELSTGNIIYANAGHEDPAVYRKDGEFALYKTKHGIPIGAMSGFRYKDFEMKLEYGDKLFIYTDGVPEATDVDDNMFGLQGMVDTLNEYRDKTPEEILKGVHSTVDNYAGEAPQFDDLTMLCFEYLPEKTE